MPNIQQDSIDFIKQISDKKDGFRLQSVELYNWGTWDKKYFVFNLQGENSLLTGETGSGKSTLVDAITTLLVPQAEISYNKAADAKRSERNLRTYIRGNYRSASSENSGEKEAVYLRSKNFYTIISARFFNKEANLHVTLCQIMYLANDQQASVKIIYIATQKDISISKELNGLGSNHRDIKKHLAKLGINTFSSFKDYRNEFMRLLGIGDVQALSLFSHAISMKEVRNISSFVREFMLSYQDPNIDQLVQNYSDLLTAYNKVQKAKDQKELLIPIKEKGLEYQSDNTNLEQLNIAYEALDNYIKHLSIKPLDNSIVEQEQNLEVLGLKHKELNLKLDDLNTKKEALSAEINNNGGARIEQVKKDIRYQEQMRSNVYENFVKYKTNIELLGEEAQYQVESFIEQKNKLAQITEDCKSKQEKLSNDITENALAIKENNSTINSLQEELASLMARRSNIPSKQIEIRENIIDAIGVNEDDLPFVGELIDVKESEKAQWQGAIERVLHGFALSLLVPEHLYKEVSDYVDRHNLKARLVYYKVAKEQYNNSIKTQIDGRALFTKLDVKADMGIFSDFVKNNLINRFDYICTHNMSDFRILDKAISVNGQIKHSKNRHEKDDRSSLSDRRNYCLGWSNQEKIKLIRDELIESNNKAQELNTAKQKLNDIKKELDLKFSSLSILQNIASDFSQIDYQKFDADIKVLQTELLQIQNKSSTLQELQNQKNETIALIKKLQIELENINKKIGSLESNIKIYKDKRDLFIQELELEPQEHKASYSFLDQILKDKNYLVLDVYDETKFGSLKSFMSSYFRDNISKIQKKVDNLLQVIIKLMNSFCYKYPESSDELNANIDCLADFNHFLEQIEKEDLPKYTEAFKNKLHIQTLQDIASLIGNLTRYKDHIHSKINEINKSLRGIDYNKDRYIELKAIDNNDADIKKFNADLKECMINSFDDEDFNVTQQRFEKIKNLIEILKNREEHKDADAKYTKKVTDVRNWFTFAAVEKDRAENIEQDYYQDSDGKSGGQKEKLAYTILAASLAYQYSAQMNTNSVRSFRLVIIDEAFGRGSEESAEFALKLFNTLNLQLLVVTPKQKISVIENYVKSVGLVQFDGMRSSIINMSIDKYHELKDASKHRAIELKDLNVKLEEV